MTRYRRMTKWMRENAEVFARILERCFFWTLGAGFTTAMYGAAPEDLIAWILIATSFYLGWMLLMWRVVEPARDREERLHDEQLEEQLANNVKVARALDRVRDMMNRPSRATWKKVESAMEVLDGKKTIAQANEQEAKSWN